MSKVQEHLQEAMRLAQQAKHLVSTVSIDDKILAIAEDSGTMVRLAKENSAHNLAHDIVNDMLICNDEFTTTEVNRSREDARMEYRTSSVLVKPEVWRAIMGALARAASEVRWDPTASLVSTTPHG